MHGQQNIIFNISDLNKHCADWNLFTQDVQCLFTPAHVSSVAMTPPTVRLEIV